MSVLKDCSPNEISLANFLTLVFKGFIKEVDPKNHVVFFTSERSKVHQLFKGMKDIFSPQFPVLSEMSFSNQGAFPWSKELDEAMGILIMNGQKFSLDGAWGLKWFPDSDEIINEDLNELLGSNQSLIDTFRELVWRVRDLVVPSPINGSFPPLFYARA